MSLADIAARGTTSSLQDYFRTDVLDSTVSKYTKAPLLITIWLGANDAVLPPSLAHVPLERFEANICEYVNRILTQRGWETTCVLLITPPPVNVRTISYDSSDEDDDLGPAVESTMQEIRRTAENGIFHRTGCGLPGSKSFGDGWFTDGLHLGPKVSSVES